jgi:hypothetical protein
MQFVIAHASALSPAATQALSGLALPNLERLLARLSPVAPAAEDLGDELSLSAPHERALAQAWGWPVADGLLPLATLSARADGLVAEGEGWGLISPTHWHLGTEQVSLANPAELDLDEPTARALFDVLRPLFEEDGWRLHWGAPTRWYVQHPQLASLPTASLDRVIGRNVDWWLNDHPAAKQIRRLQAEVQMLLYTHPLNDEREARGQLPVNSFWLSGTGPALPPPATDAVTLDDRLRGPVLADDWAAWAEAWQALDATRIPELLARLDQGQPLRLTLCGERHARHWAPQPLPWWRRLLPRARPHAAALLQEL